MEDDGLSDLPTALCEAVDELVAEGPATSSFFRGARSATRRTPSRRTRPACERPAHPGAIDILPLYGR